jgi:hypothetical protein
MRVRIQGNLLGRKLDGSKAADIVQVPKKIADGPAENSFVLIELSSHPRARYISWIGYFDVEYASRREPGAWTLVEPATIYENDVDWQPYGWEGVGRIPTIGDSILDEISRSG